MGGSRWRSASKRDRRGGFALIEVMLALMLIAALAALALPGLVRTPGPAALRVTAFQLSALLREDRNAAQNGGRAFDTRIDADGRRISSGAFSTFVSLPEGTMVRLIDTRSPTIRFFPDGQSSGGIIQITAGAARYLVVVRRDTGAILVSGP